MTFSGALFLLVLALVRGNDEGWGSTLIVVAASRARRCSWPRSSWSSAASREPMLPLGLFKRPAFTGVQLAAFAVSGSMFALFLYLTLYLQNYLGSPRSRPACATCRSRSRASSRRRSRACSSRGSPRG